MNIECPVQYGLTMEEEQIVLISPTFDIDEEWVQDYIEQFGTEPSFF